MVGMDLRGKRDSNRMLTTCTLTSSPPDTAKPDTGKYRLGGSPLGPWIVQLWVSGQLILTGKFAGTVAWTG